jgi:hypothetical protein
MQQMGIASGVVNASGDLTAWVINLTASCGGVGIVKPDGSGESFRASQCDQHGDCHIG